MCYNLIGQFEQPFQSIRALSERFGAALYKGYVKLLLRSQHIPRR